MGTVPFCSMSVVPLAVLLTFGGCRGGQGGPSPRATARVEVELAVREFLSAFEALDWERFSAAFDNDATVFFPMPEPPNRFTGRSEFEPQFRKVFAAIRASNPNGPPFHQLKPEDLTIAILGDDVALVTFLLRNEVRTARRTMILVRSENKWLIHHLHASNVPNESGA